MTKLTKRQNVVQALQFTLFSASAGLIQIATFTLLFEVVKAPNRLSYFCALVLSVLYNFTLNRSFTFKSAANVPIAMMKVALYYALFTPLSTWWIDPLVAIGINEYIALGATMIVNFVTEFLFYRLVVYRTSMYTNKRALSKHPKDSSLC